MVCGGPDLPTQKYSVFSPHWNSNQLLKQHHQSHRLWSIINRIKNCIMDTSSINYLQDTISKAFVLEDIIQQTVSSLAPTSIAPFDLEFQQSALALIDFYSCTELHKKQIKLSNYSLLHSILADTTSTSQILSSNHYQALFNIDDCDDTMEIDSPTDSQSHTKTKVVSWSTDAGVSTLTEELFSHMTERKQLAEDTGDYDEFPEYKTPE